MAGGVLLGCEDNAINGSGNLVIVEKDYQDFTGVDLAHAVEASIIRSDSFSVVITVDDNIEEYINVKKADDTLEIYLDEGYHYRNVTVEAEISMPYLDDLELSGASRADVSGFVSERDLDISVSGASKVNGDTTAGNVDIRLSGASKISLDGNGNDTVIKASGASQVNMDGFAADGDVDIDLSGASSLSLQGNGVNLKLKAMGASEADLEDYQAINADIYLSGASKGTINMSGTLDADITGSSKLRYYGNPTMGDIETSGASSIKSIG
jgi:hypothetical protein